MMRFQRPIEDIVETIQLAKAHGRGCSLLVGAGCSVKAGIPLASGFVELIKELRPSAYSRAEEKTYPKCMAELHLDERRDLISEYVDKAKINWGHVCMALLIQNGYVDRVLTTNFDLLVVRACALLGEFPAIYDFAASQLFKAANIPDKAVFYLHGQRTGFILINTEEEFKKHSDLLGPVFEDAGRGHVWIVVGYSGENDPVFDHLAKVNRFDNGLYWIGYQDNEPALHVREKLLIPEKGAYYLNGFDADSFFIELTQKLYIFPPAFIGQPFTHLDRTLELLTPFTLPGQTAEEDVINIPRQWIKGAIEQYENRGSLAAAAKEVPYGANPELLASLNAAAQRLLMAGDYEGVLTFLEHHRKSPSPELAETLTWAYIFQGNNYTELAKAKTGEEADRVFAQAAEKYQAALTIKSDSSHALNHWGAAIFNHAQTKKTFEEADILLREAIEKYQAALTIKPDMHKALAGLSASLIELGRTKNAEEAETLFRQAIEKLQPEIAIKPDDLDILGVWAVAHAALGRIKDGEEAEILFRQAIEQYQNILNVKPDHHIVLYNMGGTLIDQARAKIGEEAARLYDQAKEKLLKAEELKPGSGAYNLACLYSMIGDEASCRQWLEKSLEVGTLPRRQHLLKDPDLENVRKLEWFKELLPNK
ncbi:MAG: hypothetical protein NTY36_14605 [Deltaproteobacteria bacterium]|nr:hypothetical protein [Deltaproteobacteria bacterium]